MGDDWTAPLPVRRVVQSRDATLSVDQWPATLAPIAQILERGLDLAQATVVVGENGTGKSTFVEAVATAYGLSPEGGSTGAQHSTRPSESALSESISLVRGPGASRWGYFLRAETMHGLFTYLEQNPSPRGETRFHELSHGESFIAMLNSDRFTGEGCFVMDEPEAGLSFTAQLALVGALIQLVAQPGVQVLIATHSPVVASLPGATILEFDAEGVHQRAWDDLEIVEHYRRFLEAPERYLRHLRYWAPGGESANGARHDRQERLGQQAASDAGRRRIAKGRTPAATSPLPLAESRRYAGHARVYDAAGRERALQPKAYRRDVAELGPLALPSCDRTREGGYARWATTREREERPDDSQVGPFQGSLSPVRRSSAGGRFGAPGRHGLPESPLHGKWTHRQGTH